jgi:hypothetical protein
MSGPHFLEDAAGSNTIFKKLRFQGKSHVSHNDVFSVSLLYHYPLFLDTYSGSLDDIYHPIFLLFQTNLKLVLVVLVVLAGFMLSNHYFPLSGLNMILGTLNHVL